MLLFESAAQKDERLVKGPIVIDALNKAEVKALAAYVARLENTSVGKISRAESARLSPYFDAMSAYLNSLHGNTDMPHTSASLKDKFNAVAAVTRNLIISDVVLVPHTIWQAKNAPEAFGAGQFNVGYEYNGHNFGFGFVQLFQKSLLGDDKSSTTFSTFTLDAAMLDRIAPHAPRPMLESLKAVMTLVNHDPLHHFTTRTIRDVIAKNFYPTGAHYIQEWRDSLPNARHGEKYESIVHMGHEKILLTPAASTAVTDTQQHLALFWAEIARIADDAAQDKTASGINAHDIVDYYSMVMAHSLMRLYPLDHPVVANFLDQIEKHDPAPEETFQQFSHAVYFDRIGFGSVTVMSKEQCLLFGDRIDRSCYTQVIQAYEKSGIDMTLREGETLTYKKVKYLQLLLCSENEMHPHAPVLPHDDMSLIRADTGRAMRDMMRAADQLIGAETRTDRLMRLIP